MSESIFESRLKQLSAPYVETEAYILFGKNIHNNDDLNSSKESDIYVMKYKNEPLNTNGKD